MNKLLYIIANNLFLIFTITFHVLSENVHFYSCKSLIFVHLIDFCFQSNLYYSYYYVYKAKYIYIYIILVNCANFD